MAITVGCSVWSYDDWVGMFYPTKLAKKKGEWFAYYASYFKTVEINSTFYSMPDEFTVRSWIKKAKEKGDRDFEYSLKVPQQVTHKSMVQGDVQRSVFFARTFEETCLKPLSEVGLMGCALIQLSPYFRNEGSSLSILEKMLDALSTCDYDYSVEFRHRSWLDKGKKEIDAAVLDALRQRNVANVLIDSPGFPITNEETADHAYIRFHGRNLDIWYGDGKDKRDENDEKMGDYRINRYDYLYTSDQLESWVPRVRDAEIKAEKVRIYFNNHARSKAVRNAFELMDMLLIEHRSKEIGLQDQFTLGSFAPDRV